MAYYLDLFSPETYETFSASLRTITGFRERQKNAASKVKVGDKLVCYMTKLSRWVGILEVKSRFFIDSTPLHLPDNDPFIIRFTVEPIVWLEKEKAIPIREDRIWNHLSITQSRDRRSSEWTGRFRSSLTQLSDHDGKFLEGVLEEQAKKGNEFPIDQKEYEKMITHHVRGVDKVIKVTVPQNGEGEVEESVENQTEIRESIKIQALLASIGDKMGLSIWIPKNDRSGVLSEWKGDHKPPLDVLPLNYDSTTLKTIEQIDILWLKGRAIVRAFEVEHTTSIYSGILRMADLLALQPNMAIKLHIVAPESRREKVLQEIQRPIFSFLDRGPLSETCTFLSYDSVREIANLKHLVHLSDTVLEDYTEEAE